MIPSRAKDLIGLPGLKMPLGAIALTMPASSLPEQNSTVLCDATF